MTDLPVSSATSAPCVTTDVSAIAARPVVSRLMLRPWV